MAKSRAFYEGLLGFRVVWSPDPAAVYLTTGTDNLALHQMPAGVLTRRRPRAVKYGALDHLGLIAKSPKDVVAIARAMRRAGVTILKSPRRHRDGSYSFYMADPDRNVVQVLYEPTLSRQRFLAT